VGLSSRIVVALSALVALLSLGYLGRMVLAYQGAELAGGGGRLLQMEVVSGDVTDFLDFGKPVALAIKAPRLPGQVQEVSVFVAGLDYFPGKYGLVELTLKYDD
jgi:hypothetical protein